MNKPEFIAALKAYTGFTTEQAVKAYDGVFAVITEALKNHDTVAVKSFGEFRVHERAGHAGVNPQTREKIQISASKVPTFKSSYKLRELVR